MNDFNKLLWGFIFSAAGIIFGWTLNQLGQWFRGRQEDKRNLKFVLFNLLETYFIFVRSDIDKFANKITNKVHSKIPKEHQTEESKAFIQTLYSGVLTSYLKPELQSELKVIQENYQNSIKTLATIDPLTAYYLNGKNNILEIFDLIQELFDNLKEQYPTEQGEIEKGGRQAMRIIKPEIFQSTLLDLEKDILDIAWKVSPWTWVRSKRAIKRLKINAEKRIDKEIDELFEKLSPLFGKQ